VPKIISSAFRPPGLLPKKVRAISNLLFCRHIDPPPILASPGLSHEAAQSNGIAFHRLKQRIAAKFLASKSSLSFSMNSPV
jgi:hypothetical protein